MCCLSVKPDKALMKAGAISSVGIWKERIYAFSDDASKD